MHRRNHYRYQRQRHIRHKVALYHQIGRSAHIPAWLRAIAGSSHAQHTVSPHRGLSHCDLMKLQSLASQLEELHHERLV